MREMSLKDKVVLVTGAAGFIGYHLVKRLIEEYGKSIRVVCVDNMNSYYDVKLKEERISKLHKISSIWFCDGIVYSNFTIAEGDISDKEFVSRLFIEEQPDIVVNLAAQAGVRYSIENPDCYIKSNIEGFYNILEACRHYGVEHLVYASSSSVYGNNSTIPYSVEDKTDEPVSLYAATKKSNELLAYAYSSLYKIPITGLRFFTVYGPYGRPDMAYFSFTEKLVRGEKIKVFNYGDCKRDFTYIDDIIEGVMRVLYSRPGGSAFCSEDVDIVPNKLYNIGNSNPVKLMDFISILSEELIRVGLLPDDFDIMKSVDLLPMQKGDVEVTYANVSALEKDFNFRPRVDLREGLRNFVEWYKSDYKK